MRPEFEYGQTTDPVEQRRLEREVVGAYRPQVASLVRKLVLPHQGWEDAEQSALIGLLEALKAFAPDPSIPGQDGGAFWSFAKRLVQNAIQAWLDKGVYWRPRSHHRGKVNASPVVLDSEAVQFHADSAPNVEELVAKHEVYERLTEHVETLSVADRKTLFSEPRESSQSKGYLSLVAGARRAVLGRTEDVPAIVVSALPTVSDRR